MTWLYLALNLGALAAPLALSFDRRVAFYRRWGAAFGAIGIMMLLFVPADIAFTVARVWGFDPRYVLGVWWLGLPLEEWLFFVVVGYACLFIYECLRAYVRRDVLARSHRGVLWVMAGFGLALVVSHHDHLYTSLKVGASVAGIVLSLFLVDAITLSRFVLMYLLSLVPFFLMNGVLTGSLIDGQVVWYDPNHIVGLRLITIPVEDLFYSLLMLLVTTVVFERLRSALGRTQ